MVGLTSNVNDTAGPPDEENFSRKLISSSNKWNQKSSFSKIYCDSPAPVSGNSTPLK